MGAPLQASSRLAAVRGEKPQMASEDHPGHTHGDEGELQGGIGRGSQRRPEACGDEPVEASQAEAKDGYGEARPDSGGRQVVGE